MSLLASKNPREPWAELMLEGAQEIADLRRKATLTAAESGVLATVSDIYAAHDDDDSCADIAAVIDGLLGRLG